jgi:hypothetical protein
MASIRLLRLGKDASSGEGFHLGEGAKKSQLVWHEQHRQATTSKKLAWALGNEGTLFLLLPGLLVLMLATP